MRCWLFVAMTLALLLGCNQKQKISPDRYGAPRAGEQQSPGPVLAPPSSTPAPGPLKESDVTTPAPQPTPGPGKGSVQPVQAYVPESKEEVTYQIGAFSQLDNARELARKAREAGFSAQVEEDEATSIAQHRVVVTYPGSDNEARSKLLDIGVYDPILLGGRVNHASETAQPPDREEPGTGQGQPDPADAPPAVGGVSYQVGAFADVENAVQIKRQLEEDGFYVRMEKTADTDPRYRVIATWPGSDEEGRARLLEHDIFIPIIVNVDRSSSQASPPARQPYIAAEQSASRAESVAPAQPEPAAPRPAKPEPIPQVKPAGPAKPAAPPASQPAAASAPAPETPEAPEAPDSADDAFKFQVGAFDSIKNAESLRDNLEKAGFRTELELVEQGGKPTYRLLAIKPGSVPSLRNQLMGLGVRNPILLGY